ncbi:MAG: MBL fold metallo-hydrolase, partial [Coriobacteriia bacterium]|nr:MBL fold metallo-hydrolase [Coriobacteriia bacterium]
MRLTVLGSSASYAGPGQACAGHLVQFDSTCVLLDCGNGVIANLGRVMEPADLDAVLITHAHLDHFADIYALQALLRYAPGGPCGRLKLGLAPGLIERILAPLSSRGKNEFLEAFQVMDLIAGHTLQVGGLAITPALVDHSDPTFALLVEHGPTRLCYTADTKLGDRVMAVAAGANLLLAEATLPQEYVGQAPHMTAAQAGTLAYQAGALQLVLTHLWPTNDRESAQREASAAFGAHVYAGGAYE